jgi:hypothetical protein|tara:strand:- start:1479 stop:1802 length:324 start_codon:yes stop_codon:yes gene_type:complete
MNTIENNKIIAEFMNVDYITELNKLRDNSTNDEPLKMWHNDWSWLMEVVEKIESLGNNVQIFSFSCVIEPNDKRNVIIQSGSVSLNKSKINATYNAVVYFIKSKNLI